MEYDQELIEQIKEQERIAEERARLIEQIKEQDRIAEEKARNRPLWFKIAKWLLWFAWFLIAAAFMICVCFPILLFLSIITGGRVTSLGLNMDLLAPKGRISKF